MSMSKYLTLIKQVYVLIACEHIHDPFVCARFCFSFCFFATFRKSSWNPNIIMTWSEDDHSKLYVPIMLQVAAYSHFSECVLAQAPCSPGGLLSPCMELRCEEWMRSTAAIPLQIKYTSGGAMMANSQNRTWSQAQLLVFFGTCCRKPGSMTPTTLPFLATVRIGIIAH